MHDLLFDRRAVLGLEPWASLAAKAGVNDTVAFNRCLRTDAVAQRVEEDVSAASRLHLRGTPALLVNDSLYEGLMTERQLDRIIANAVRASVLRSPPK